MASISSILILVLGKRKTSIHNRNFKKKCISLHLPRGYPFFRDYQETEDDSSDMADCHNLSILRLRRIVKHDRVSIHENKVHFKTTKEEKTKYLNLVYFTALPDKKGIDEAKKKIKDTKRWVRIKADG
jgi:hypothetical protein